MRRPWHKRPHLDRGPGAPTTTRRGRCAREAKPRVPRARGLLERSTRSKRARRSVARDRVPPLAPPPPVRSQQPKAPPCRSRAGELPAMRPRVAGLAGAPAGARPRGSTAGIRGLARANDLRDAGAVPTPRTRRRSHSTPSGRPACPQDGLRGPCPENIGRATCGGNKLACTTVRVMRARQTPSLQAFARHEPLTTGGRT